MNKRRKPIREREREIERVKREREKYWRRDIHVRHIAQLHSVTPGDG